MPFIRAIDYIRGGQRPFFYKKRFHRKFQGNSVHNGIRNFKMEFAYGC